MPNSSLLGAGDRCGNSGEDSKFAKFGGLGAKNRNYRRNAKFAQFGRKFDSFITFAGEREEILKQIWNLLNLEGNLPNSSLLGGTRVEISEQTQNLPRLVGNLPNLGAIWGEISPI